MSKRDREAVNRGLDQVFASESGDLLNNVIQSDRRRAGRAGLLLSKETAPSGEKPLSFYDDRTSQNVISEYDNKADIQTSNMATTQADKQASQPVMTPADKFREAPVMPVPKLTLPRKHKNPAGPTDLVNARMAEGRCMAESPTTTVTLRLPRGLNDWLDEYVHRAWPERVRKQELVAEALRMLFVRRGRPGERILDTELLSQDEP